MNGIQEAPMSGDAPNASPIIGIEKRCTKCKKQHPISLFSIRKDRGKPIAVCNNCERERSRQRYQKDPERQRSIGRAWKARNKEKIKIYTKDRYAKHRERLIQKAKEYKKRHPKSKRVKKKKTISKMNKNFAKYIRDSLRYNKRGKLFQQMVGYSAEDLKKHLEKQFKEGMSWENRGVGGWHIDHIIPVSAFNFEKPEDEDFKRCWALKNLQPLWAIENIKKSNKILRPIQPSLIFK